MPELARAHLEADHLRLTAIPAQHAAVGELASSAGIERCFGEHHLAGRRGGDGGLHDQRVGMFMAVKMHGPRLATRTRLVLAKIARRILPSRARCCSPPGISAISASVTPIPRG